MVQVLVGILELIALAALLGCVVGWIFGFLRLFKRQPLLQPEARTRSLAGFAEVIMVIGLWFVLLVAGLSAAQQFGWIEARESNADLPVNLDPDMIVRVMMDGGSRLAAIALLLVWLSFLDGQVLRRMGLIPRVRDLKIGFVTAAMVIPPVLMLQQLLSLLIPYEHPVKDMIEARPSFWTGLLLVINTVFIAPFAEEFFFRGLFQGWLQRVARHGVLKSFATERVDTGTEPFGRHEEQDNEGVDSEAVHAGEAPRDPYRSPPAIAAGRAESSPSSLSEWIPADEVRHWPWWPIVVTSIFFGLIHWGHGAAPVSLFFLAMGLGYVTRQTGSLWPAITVHFSLNACATAAMFLTAEMPTDPPPLGP